MNITKRSTLNVTGETVRLGDIVLMGGNPHTVSDVRTLHGGRKLLRFADGNAYVLGCACPIEVVRAYAVPVPTVRVPRSAAAVRAGAALRASHRRAG